MKVNQPVTDREVNFREGQFIVSTTDLKGAITSVNRDFIEISGFSEQELLGRNHNIVRHPDMPPAAFADLWRTVKSGRPWTGLVKNRCKNGDFYWVKANVTPVRSGGSVTGYLSVRTAPARAEVAAADALYRRINAGQATLGPGFTGRLVARLGRVSIRWWAGCYLGVTMAMLAGFAWLGAQGLATGTLALALGAAALLLGGSGLLLGRHVTVPVATAITTLRQIAEGDYFQWVETARDDEFGRLLQNLKSTQIRLGSDVNEMRSQARTTGRIKQALDNVSANVMVADANHNIIYMNKTVAAMFRNAQGDIRRDLPQFDVDRLLGVSIDTFHKNPAHQRAVLEQLTDTYTAEIKVGGRTMQVIANPIIDTDGSRLGTVVEWADLTEEYARQAEEQQRLEQEREQAAANGRIRQALDNVSGNVMIADTDGVIIYMNGACSNMMQNAEQDIRKDLPSFNSGRLIGTNIDSFHKNPAHQRNLLAGLRETYTADMLVGGRSMRVTANPVIEAGKRLGTVVEWEDRTQQVAIEDEIQEIVNAALAGNLRQRIDLADKSGFLERLSHGVNDLVDVSERVINDTVAVFGAMARGDLTRHIEADYQGTFGQLKDNANSTIARLTEVLGEINSSANTVLSASGEIAEGNTNLSQRTEEQAASLEETASSMEEMTSTVRQNAENARQANQLAAGAREQAEKGGSVVGNAVSAMGEITSSSKKIADIISVIDEIAFQTNLLALNAAVEAARAGEQGRGFAVVASEVRNLAGRSALAAKEIKGLIEDSVLKVEEGSKLVDESGRTLEEIVRSVKKVSEIIAEIAAASQEQSDGIEQVNIAISQMDEMTQQNAALVEEATAASESMGEQARALHELVGFFTTSSGAQAAAVERRSGNRPWSGGGRHAGGATSRGKSSGTDGRQQGTGTDGDWDEF